MFLFLVFFFFKQKTAYEMRISDWSSDVCSSDLSFGSAVDWIAGLFYYDDRSLRVDTFTFGADSVIGAARGAGQVDVASTRYRTKSVAGFAQATWHITPTLDLTLGGRYTEDRKRAVSLGTTTAPRLPLVSAPFVTQTLKDTFTSFDPRIP